MLLPGITDPDTLDLAEKLCGTFPGRERGAEHVQPAPGDGRGHDPRAARQVRADHPGQPAAGDRPHADGLARPGLSCGRRWRGRAVAPLLAAAWPEPAAAGPAATRAASRRWRTGRPCWCPSRRDEDDAELFPWSGVRGDGGAIARAWRPRCCRSASTPSGSASLDAREGEHYQAVSESLAKLHAALEGLQGTVADHAGILASLDGLDETRGYPGRPGRLPDAAGRGGPGERYQPIPTVNGGPWPSEEREKRATARIRGWVAQIYRPFYGHLAARLGDCWEQHPLCLVSWTGCPSCGRCWISSRTARARDLAAQAELGTRIIPAVAEQLAAETTGCEHSRALNGPGRLQGRGPGEQAHASQRSRPPVRRARMACRSRASRGRRSRRPRTASRTRPQTTARSSGGGPGTRTGTWR